MDHLEELTTEQPNPLSLGIGTKTSKEIARIIDTEDCRVQEAVAREIPAIVAVVDAVVDGFNRGGLLIYDGAGTSGRLGVLDAAECSPTYGVPPEMVQGIIAGGHDPSAKGPQQPDGGLKAGEQQTGDPFQAADPSGHWLRRAFRRAGL